MSFLAFQFNLLLLLKNLKANQRGRLHTQNNGQKQLLASTNFTAPSTLLARAFGFHVFIKIMNLPLVMLHNASYFPLVMLHNASFFFFFFPISSRQRPLASSHWRHHETGCCLVGVAPRPRRLASSATRASCCGHKLCHGRAPAAHEPRPARALPLTGSAPREPELWRAHASLSVGEYR